MESINVESPRPRTSALAIWSLVLGVLSFIGSCVTGVPAIILGAIGLKKIGDSNGMLTGKGLAIAGIICGSVLTLLSVVFASMALPAYNKISERAKITMEANNVKQLMLAARSWSADNNGAFPPNLKALQPDYIDIEFLQYHNQATYHYVPGLTDTSNAGQILIYSDEYPTNPPKRVVGMAGGQVIEMSPDDFEAAMSQ